MYLGIDFLVGPGLEPCLIEVNVGCRAAPTSTTSPAGSTTAIPRASSGRSRTSPARPAGRPSPATSARSWLGSLKEPQALDGRTGSLPGVRSPALRLEDKWVQYRILSAWFRMPETMVLEPGDLPAAKRFLARRGRLVAKRRLGRGGRGLKGRRRTGGPSGGCARAVRPPSPGMDRVADRALLAVPPLGRLRGPARLPLCQSGRPGELQPRHPGLRRGRGPPGAFIRDRRSRPFRFDRSVRGRPRC
ncbi:MAG: hypothetical protein MZV63_13440 [Marinilabiliales bacterium]|nr:hypothetical protein [Marinilabiliales bacterium]